MSNTESGMQKNTYTQCYIPHTFCIRLLYLLSNFCLTQFIYPPLLVTWTPVVKSISTILLVTSRSMFEPRVGITTFFYITVFFYLCVWQYCNDYWSRLVDHYQWIRISLGVLYIQPGTITKLYHPVASWTGNRSIFNIEHLMCVALINITQ